MFNVSGKKVSLVFYVGSSAVKAALVDFHSEDKPRILFKTESFIEISEGLDYSHLPKLVSRAAGRASNNIIESEIWNEGEVKMENIHCIFSPLWYSAKIENISFKGETFTFTEEVLEDAVEQVKDEAQNVGGFEKELIIEQKGVRTRLNGYMVNDPYNKKVSRCLVNVFLSSLSRKIHDELTEVLSKYFNEREIFFHSSAISNFAVISRDMETNGNFLIVEVDGEITQLLVSYDNMIQQVGTFPLGLNYFIKALSKKTDKSPEECLSEINLFAAGELEEKRHDRVEGMLSEVADNWVEDIRELLQNFSREVAIPSNAFLVANEKVLKWLSSLLKDERLQPFTLLDKPLKVTSLDPSKVGDFVKWNKELEPNNVISISTSYIHYYSNESSD